MVHGKLIIGSKPGKVRNKIRFFRIRLKKGVTRNTQKEKIKVRRRREGK